MGARGIAPLCLARTVSRVSVGRVARLAGRPDCCRGYGRAPQREVEPQCRALRYRPCHRHKCDTGDLQFVIPSSEKISMSAALNASLLRIKSVVRREETTLRLAGNGGPFGMTWADDVQL